MTKTLKQKVMFLKFCMEIAVMKGATDQDTVTMRHKPHDPGDTGIAGPPSELPPTAPGIKTTALPASGLRMRVQKASPPTGSPGLRPSHISWLSLRP